MACLGCRPVHWGLHHTPGGPPHKPHPSQLHSGGLFGCNHPGHSPVESEELHYSRQTTERTTGGQRSLHVCIHYLCYGMFSTTGLISNSQGALVIKVEIGQELSNKLEKICPQTPPFYYVHWVAGRHSSGVCYVLSDHSLDSLTLEQGLKTEKVKSVLVTTLKDVY